MELYIRLFQTCTASAVPRVRRHRTYRISGFPLNALVVSVLIL